MRFILENEERQRDLMILVSVWRRERSCFLCFFITLKRPTLRVLNADESKMFQRASLFTLSCFCAHCAAVTMTSTVCGFFSFCGESSLQCACQAVSFPVHVLKRRWVVKMIDPPTTTTTAKKSSYDEETFKMKTSEKTLNIKGGQKKPNDHSNLM